MRFLADARRSLLATVATLAVTLAWVVPVAAAPSRGCDALEDVTTFLTTQVGRSSDAAIHVQLVWETACVDED